MLVYLEEKRVLVPITEQRDFILAAIKKEDGTELSQHAFYEAEKGTLKAVFSNAVPLDSVASLLGEPVDADQEEWLCAVQWSYHGPWDAKQKELAIQWDLYDAEFKQAWYARILQKVAFLVAYRKEYTALEHLVENAEDCFQNPLNVYARYGHVEKVMQLLPFSEFSQRIAALMEAASCERQEVVDYLLSSFQKEGTFDAAIEQIFSEAILKEKKESVVFFAEVASDIALKKALDFAAQLGKANITAFLIDHLKGRITVDEKLRYFSDVLVLEHLGLETAEALFESAENDASREKMRAIFHQFLARNETGRKKQQEAFLLLCSPKCSSMRNMFLEYFKGREELIFQMKVVGLRQSLVNKNLQVVQYLQEAGHLEQAGKRLFSDFVKRRGEAAFISSLLEVDELKEILTKEYSAHAFSDALQFQYFETAEVLLQHVYTSIGEERIRCDARIQETFAAFIKWQSEKSLEEKLKALSFALSHGYTKVEALLEDEHKGEYLNVLQGALKQAFLKEKAQVVNFLLDIKSDYSDTFLEICREELYKAIQDGNRSTTRFLINHLENKFNGEDRAKAFHIAIQGADLKVAEILLEEASTNSEYKEKMKETFLKLVFEQQEGTGEYKESLGSLIKKGQALFFTLFKHYGDEAARLLFIRFEDNQNELINFVSWLLFQAILKEAYDVIDFLEDLGTLNFPEVSKQAFFHALKAGELHVAERVLEQLCLGDQDKEAIEKIVLNAIINGNIEALRFLYSNFQTKLLMPASALLLKAAVVNQQLEVMDYLLKEQSHQLSLKEGGDILYTALSNTFLKGVTLLFTHLKKHNAMGLLKGWALFFVEDSRQGRCAMEFLMAENTLEPISQSSLFRALLHFVKCEQLPMISFFLEEPATAFIVNAYQGTKLISMVQAGNLQEIKSMLREDPAGQEIRERLLADALEGELALVESLFVDRDNIKEAVEMMNGISLETVDTFKEMPMEGALAQNGVEDYYVAQVEATLEAIKKEDGTVLSRHALCAAERGALKAVFSSAIPSDTVASLLGEPIDPVQEEWLCAAQWSLHGIGDVQQRIKAVAFGFYSETEKERYTRILKKVAFLCAYRKEYAALEQLIEGSKESYPDPFIAYAAYGDVQKVEQLLPFSNFSQQVEALIQAASHEYLEVVDCLFIHFKEVGILDEVIEEVFSEATLKGRKDMIEFFSLYASDATFKKTLTFALTLGKADITKLLIELKRHISVEEKLQLFCDVLALESAELETAEVVLESAKENTVCKEGMRAIFHQFLKSHTQDRKKQMELFFLACSQDCISIRNLFQQCFKEEKALFLNITSAALRRALVNKNLQVVTSLQEMGLLEDAGRKVFHDFVKRPGETEFVASLLAVSHLKKTLTSAQSAQAFSDALKFQSFETAEVLLQHVYTSVGDARMRLDTQIQETVAAFIKGQSEKSVEEQMKALSFALLYGYNTVEGLLESLEQKGMLLSALRDVLKQALLKEKAHVIDFLLNAKPRYYDTLLAFCREELYEAASKGNVSVTQFLLHYLKEKFNGEDRKRAFDNALQGGELKAAEILLEEASEKLVYKRELQKSFMQFGLNLKGGTEVYQEDVESLEKKMRALFFTLFKGYGDKMIRTLLLRFEEKGKETVFLNFAAWVLFQAFLKEEHSVVDFLQTLEKLNFSEVSKKAFFYALKDGQIQVAKRALQQCCFSDQDMDALEQIMLHALLKEDREVLRFLLSDIQTSFLISCAKMVLTAAEHQKLDIMHFLLEGWGKRITPQHQGDILFGLLANKFLKGVTLFLQHLKAEKAVGLAKGRALLCVREQRYQFIIEFLMGESTLDPIAEPLLFRVLLYFVHIRKLNFVHFFVKCPQVACINQAYAGTPLLSMVEKGNLEEIESLLLEDPAGQKMRGRLLCEAALEGELWLVEFLLHNKIDTVEVEDIKEALQGVRDRNPIIVKYLEDVLRGSLVQEQSPEPMEVDALRERMEQLNELVERSKAQVLSTWTSGSKRSAEKQEMPTKLFKFRHVEVPSQEKIQEIQEHPESNKRRAEKQAMPRERFKFQCVEQPSKEDLEEAGPSRGRQPRNS